MIGMWQFSHFMQIWIFPPGVILLLMMSGLVLSWYWPRLGKCLLIFSVFYFWLLSTPMVAQRLIDELQNQYKPLVINPPLKKSAIVVLGSGVENAIEYTNKRNVSDRTLSRLHYAVYLHHALHLPMIVSGGNKNNTANTEAFVMNEILVNNYKISAQAIENDSKNTQEESKFLLPILKKRGITTIYLVTHAWHMPRSMYFFKRAFAKQNITIIPAPMGYITIQSGNVLSNWLPLLNALNTCVFAMHEYIGMIVAHFSSD